MAQSTGLDSLNPPLSSSVKIFTGAVLVVLIGGLLLFFAPQLILPRWPWTVAPFNARFLGAFYTAEGAVILSLFLTNRWSPGRMVLIMALVFTLVVTLASLLNLGYFNWGRKGPWIWLALYAGSALVAGWLYWQHRNLPQAPSIIDGTPWQRLLAVQGALSTAYGAALLIAPAIAASFWPWKIDAFHAQVYSALFLAAGIGGLLLARHAAREDLRTFGLANLVLGLGAIIGVIMVDARVHKVIWSSEGTWIWLALFAAIAVVGLGQLLHAARHGSRQAS